MPFRIIRDDITRVSADAIVNTANPMPGYADGTDRAIYTAAGADELLAERGKIGAIGRGEAAVTKAFRLPARFIIHTVGPIYKGRKEDADNLYSCYFNSLELARKNDIHSIAFPAISCGVYGFPIDKAAEIAVSTVIKYARYYNCFDKIVFIDLNPNVIYEYEKQINCHR